MTEPNVERDTSLLLTADPRLGVPIPAYGGRSLPNVVSSVVQGLGVEVRGEPSILPPLDPDLDPFGGRRPSGTVVLLLVDALGWVPPEAPGVPAPFHYPASWAARARPITTVFPTTTTVALTSLSTAQSPGRHGVVGHRVYLPAFGAVTEILRMAPSGVAGVDAFAGPEWTPAIVSGTPSIFRRGVPGIALTRDRFESSAFTRMIYDGAQFAGFSTAAEFVHQLTRLLARSPPPPLVYAYWDELDTVQHLQGPQPEFSVFVAEQVAHIFRATARGLSAERARSTTVLVTSDHGQVPATTTAEVAVDREPQLASHLARPPTGDRRAAFLAARPGHLAALTSALEHRLPPHSHLLPMAEALEAGLFGPPPFHPEIAERLGDLLVLVPAPATVTYRLPGAPAHSRFLAGAHGGLDPAELLVPFVAGPLSELG